MTPYRTPAHAKATGTLTALALITLPSVLITGPAGLAVPALLGLLAVLSALDARAARAASRPGPE